MSAVVATAVATVAAAGVSAYSASQQSKAADKRQNQAIGAQKELYGSKVKAPKFKDTVNLPEFDPQQGAKDFGASLPFLAADARSMQKSDMSAREGTAGGTFQSNLSRQGFNIQEMLKGKLPQDVVDSVTRSVAERTGGAFTPGTGGSAAEDEFGRNLGLTSVDFMTKGMSFAPVWEQLVDQFTYKPQDAGHDALAMLQARNDYNINKANIQVRRDENRYAAQANTNKANAQPDPQVVGSFRDSQTNDALRLQAKTNQLNALSGLVTAGAGAANSIYKQYNTPATTGAYDNLTASQFSALTSSAPVTSWQTSARGGSQSS